MVGGAELFRKAAGGAITDSQMVLFSDPIKKPNRQTASCASFLASAQNAMRFHPALSRHLPGAFPFPKTMPCNRPDKFFGRRVDQYAQRPGIRGLGFFAGPIQGSAYITFL